MAVNFCAKMKIGIVTEYFPKSENCETRGGIETRCFHIARELAKRHSVVIIASLEPGAPIEQAFDGIKVIRCGKPKEHCHTGRVKERLSFMRQTYKIGSELDLDLIEGADFISYLPAHYIAKKKHIPSIAWYNDVWVGKWIRNIGIQGIMGEVLERFILSRNWTYFIANSEFTRNNLLNYGVEEDKLKLIYCGVDVKKCTAIDVEKEKRPTICCVSRLVKYKKIDFLIRVLSHIKKEIPDIQCNIIGTGPELKKLEGLVQKLNLEDNVNFLGFIRKHDDVLKVIKKSHIFCLPSIVEGFGIVVIEAMACSTSYVCTNIAALKEVTNNGMGGLLFERENSDDLAKKILLLLNDSAFYNKCIHDGLKLVQRYDWKNLVRETELFYEAVRNKPIS